MKNGLGKKKTSPQVSIAKTSFINLVINLVIKHAKLKCQLIINLFEKNMYLVFVQRMVDQP